jgi:beta-lactamase class A
MRRDSFLLSASATLAVLSTPLPIRASDTAAAQLKELEAATGGRLGVMAFDTEGFTAINYRAVERFPMCSTFKFLAVSAVLSRVDRGQEQLNRHIAYGQADLLEYAPITKQHVAQGFMTVQALCEAAIVYSDNTAANLLLSTIGGPQGMTRYARSIGDKYTTLNRTEPTLNTGIPGDERDTTTPAAMAADMRNILTGNALSPASRDRLTGWLVASQTGTNLIRAGVPTTWRVGDKTGLGGPKNRVGDSNTRNDIAILWPPNKAPIIVAAYLTGSTLAAAQRDATLAHVGRIVSTTFV